MRIDHRTYSVRENLNLQVILSLSLGASYDIGVIVHGVDHNASELCIVQCKYIHNVVDVKATSYIHCYTYMYAKQKQPGCKKSARPIRSHNGYKSDQNL